MGSESKSRKRRSSPSPSTSPQSSQDEEERRKKRRKGEDKESKSRRDDDEKKKMKKKSREKSHHKHSRSRDEKEKKSKGKHKHSRKNFDSHDFKELSKDDYFSKNNEFSTWLKEEKGVYFSNLSSEAARDLFSSFVKDWNNQKLDPQYYEGISTAPRTAHNWKIRHEK